MDKIEFVTSVYRNPRNLDLRIGYGRELKDTPINEVNNLNQEAEKLWAISVISFMLDTLRKAHPNATVEELYLSVLNHFINKYGRE